MYDVSSVSLAEADCRVCHDFGVPDQHHSLFGETIPDGSVVLNPDVGGIHGSDTTYGCLSCHGTENSDDIVVVRDCTICHGDLVDNIHDGHYIPPYEPSLVTPTRSMCDCLPFNSRSIGFDACDYCHTDDWFSPSTVRSNLELHHGTDLVTDVTSCGLYHDISEPFDYQIRNCEGCHGSAPLYNIQVDSNGSGADLVSKNLGCGH
jgi:hypothetical protein